MPKHRIPRAQAEEKVASLAAAGEHVESVEDDGDTVVITTSTNRTPPTERETR